jgi:hypothetical protein
LHQLGFLQDAAISSCLSLLLHLRQQWDKAAGVPSVEPGAASALAFRRHQLVALRMQNLFEVLQPAPQLPQAPTLAPAPLVEEKSNTETAEAPASQQDGRPPLLSRNNQEAPDGQSSVAGASANGAGDASMPPSASLDESPVAAAPADFLPLPMPMDLVN